MKQWILTRWWSYWKSINDINYTNYYTAVNNICSFHGCFRQLRWWWRCSLSWCEGNHGHLGCHRRNASADGRIKLAFSKTVVRQNDCHQEGSVICKVINTLRMHINIVSIFLLKIWLSNNNMLSIFQLRNSRQNLCVVICFNYMDFGK